MAEQRKQPLTDSTVSGSTQTGRAVSLARLLHHECIQLLQLFKKRETSLSDQTPDGVRMVSLSSETTKSSIEEQVRLLHSALRQCLGMLHRVIQKEKEELGQQGDGYETLKASVRARLENLLYTTKDLLKSKDLTLEVAQDQHCNEPDLFSGSKFGVAQHGCSQIVIHTSRVVLAPPSRLWTADHLKVLVKSRLDPLQFAYQPKPGVVDTIIFLLNCVYTHLDQQEVDGMGGTFGLKMWTYRVLLELIHWADHAAKTLHVLHMQREGTK